MRNKKILILGSSGFIGKNTMKLLRLHFDLFAPSREEIDLLCADVVCDYLKNNKFDSVIHFASPTGHNPLDKPEEIFQRSLRVFESLADCSDMFGKMIYIGSGAEYGKHRSIANIREEEFGVHLPQDSYGLSRYIMSKIAQEHNNIYNLRVFGCYGAGDQPHKLIPHIIRCINEKKPIELKQNVVFDFLYVKDIAPVIEYFIENTPKYRAYNLTNGNSILIGDIATEVRRQMKSDVPIIFKQEGFGLEYTGSNERLRREIPHWLLTSIKDGISEVLEYENCKF